LFDKWKVQVEDDESYHPSQADNQEKSKLNYVSGKKARDRPKINVSSSKLAKILKSIVKESAPTATLLAEMAHYHVEVATKVVGCEKGNEAFYEYVDLHCYPFFPTLLENPTANLSKFNPKVILRTWRQRSYQRKRCLSSAKLSLECKMIYKLDTDTDDSTILI
jgi:hypothetical protein